MKTTPPTRVEDVMDPVGRTGWPKDKGRDGERTPMQWDNGPNAGFTTASARPWLPIPPQASTVNVKSEETDPDSLLRWYQTLIRLKKTNPALADGNDVVIATQNPNVLAWVRQADGAPTVVVSVNFTAEPQEVSLTAPGVSAIPRTLLKTPGAADPSSLTSVQLGPFGVYIGEVGQ
jgi:alpha-glucosidase